MAAQALMAGLNIATSALPLFFGENNIFSGKAREASREQEAAFRRSQGMQLPTEYTQALQNRLAQANVGIPSAALGLYQQQAGRAQAGQLAGLRDRRSALAGIGGIAQAGQDAALQLAYMQSQALLSGQERANQALMQMGGLKYQEELRKQEEAQQYWGGRKAEANAAVSSALAGVGQAMGSALSTGAFQGQPKLPTTPTPQAVMPGLSRPMNLPSVPNMQRPGLSAMNYLSGNTTTPLATYSFSGLSNLPRINTVYPYSNTFGMINRGTKIGQYSTTGLLGLKGPN
jgi:hypothetical protein